MISKIAVVPGGTGGVGEGIVRALLKNGYTVVVPTRTTSKAEQLQAYVADLGSGRLLTYPGSVSTEESATELKRYLHEEFKQIDLVVASLGGWHQGYPVHEYPFTAWNRILNDNLTAHFLAIKSLVPLLNPEAGFYFHINGFSAEETYPLAGPLAMAAAAQKSLILTLSKELEHTNIRVHELILGPIKTRDRLKHGYGRPEWYAPEEIGELIQGLIHTDPAERIHYWLSKSEKK